MSRRLQRYLQVNDCLPHFQGYFIGIQKLNTFFFSESQMKTAVITVPSYFSQAERRAVIRAANIASIEVIQLMDDNAAVALDFIRPRLKLIEEKPVYLFFDVGATGTTATVVCELYSHPYALYPHQLSHRTNY